MLFNSYSSFSLPCWELEFQNIITLLFSLLLIFCLLLSCHSLFRAIRSSWTTTDKYKSTCACIFILCRMDMGFHISLHARSSASHAIPISSSITLISIAMRTIGRFQILSLLTNHCLLSNTYIPKTINTVCTIMVVRPIMK